MDWCQRPQQLEHHIHPTQLNDELAMYRGQTKPLKEATSIAIVRDVIDSQTGLYDGKK